MIMTNPIEKIKNPDIKATNPDPGSTKEPISIFHARMQMKNPMLIQNNPSNFSLSFSIIDFLCLSKI
jgi:hypothetical protein